MILLDVSRLWQVKQAFAVGILAICCALALAPAGYGQTDQASQEPDRASKPTPTSTAAVQPTATPPSAGEATVYVYRPFQFSPVVHVWIYVSGGHYATLDLFTYMQARVPQGKVFIWGLGSTSDGDTDQYYLDIHGLPPPTGRWASVPGCAGLDLRLAFGALASGATADTQRTDTTPCKDALREAVAAIGADLGDTLNLPGGPQILALNKGGVAFSLGSSSSITTWRSSGPSAEVIRLCNLQIQRRGRYNPDDAYDCHREMSAALAILAGTLPAARIGIEVEAGKTYYVKWYFKTGWKTAGGNLELVNATTGAKEIHKLHPAKAR